MVGLRQKRTNWQKNMMNYSQAKAIILKMSLHTVLEKPDTVAINAADDTEVNILKVHSECESPCTMYFLLQAQHK